MQTRPKIRAYCPRKLAPLMKPARYKGAHGGRGGAKSHFFAEQVIIRCVSAPTRVACIREVQNSIRDSVRQLLIDKINKFELADEFTIHEGEIRHSNGSLIVFKGMQSFNASNIKSLEGFDIAWVEEAQTLSAASLRMLRPTIRKEGSELWFSWNPRHDTDAVDEFLRGPNKPADAVVCETNWNDNPWFPAVLKADMQADYAADPEMAAHVWGGQYEIVSEGAYYARWIAQAEKEGRIGHFPLKPRQPVHTSWDIGVDDYSAVWFWQEDGFSATVIDFYETQNDGLEQIAAYALPELFVPPPWNMEFSGWNREHALEQLGREHPFLYGKHYFPHDIGVREWGGGARERVEIAFQIGFKGVRKGVATAPEKRVAAGRALLPLTKFSLTPRVQRGIERLRRYKRKFNENMGIWQGPDKDGNDHAADAFGEFALNCGIRPPELIEKQDPIAELLKPKTLNEMIEESEWDDAA